jgi:outer membrane protein assembly factor BamB
VRWQVPIDQKLIAGLAYSTGWLIAVSEPGDLVAFRASDGAVIWRRPLGASTRFPPVTDGARAVAALTDGRVVALSLSNGEMLWQRALPGTLSQPTMTADRVFVGSDTNDFFALSADSGEIRWRWRAGGDVIGAVTDAEGRVFFASLDNLLRGLNEGNGNQRWRKEIPSRPASPPLIAGDVVLISSISPTITGYSATAGAAAGTYAAPGELQGPPLLDPVLRPFRVAMVVVTRDGRVAGVIPTAMLFKEPMLVPLQQFPGVRLGREPVPMIR